MGHYGRQDRPKDRPQGSVRREGMRRSDRDGAGVAEEPSLLVLFGRLTGIGWFVGVAIAGGIIAGWWLDSRFGIRPALTLAGLAVGIVVAAGGMLRMLRAFGGRNEDGR